MHIRGLSVNIPENVDNQPEGGPRDGRQRGLLNPGQVGGQGRRRGKRLIRKRLRRQWSMPASLLARHLVVTTVQQWYQIRADSGPKQGRWRGSHVTRCHTCCRRQ